MNYSEFNLCKKFQVKKPYYTVKCSTNVEKSCYGKLGEELVAEISKTKRNFKKSFFGHPSVQQQK